MTECLETDRLLLRPVKSEDLKRFYELLNDPEVAASTFSIPHPLSPQKAKRWLNYYVDSSQHGNDRHWAIINKSDPTMIGMVNVYDFDAKKIQAEIGFWIGKEFWAMGYGSEAVKAVVHFLMSTLLVNRLIATYQSSNLASARILKKAGLEPYRTVRILNRKTGRWIIVRQVAIEAHSFYSSASSSEMGTDRLISE